MIYGMATAADTLCPQVKGFCNFFLECDIFSLHVYVRVTDTRTTNEWVWYCNFFYSLLKVVGMVGASHSQVCWSSLWHVFPSWLCGSTLRPSCYSWNRILVSSSKLASRDWSR